MVGTQLKNIKFLYTLFSKKNHKNLIENSQIGEKFKT